MNKFAKVAFVAVFAAATEYGVCTSQKSKVMSVLVLTNVDALAYEGEAIVVRPCIFSSFFSVFIKKALPLR